jgi:hypothetical protein
MVSPRFAARNAQVAELADALASGFSQTYPFYRFQMQLPSGTLDHFRAFSGQMVGDFGGSLGRLFANPADVVETVEGSRFN